ncbi:hypothetical protein [Pseudanabaena sp. PCC 6802]|uniref:hypothetical protein n=1 Tax=Pseudanabaena sp. PCC 6802 TaxID=118173 RepID=UPI000346E92F|nr:hypothetical protein [Pseudanabaena sp. PCC 6802]
MATIAISDLSTSGYTLFSDSESYMNDLSEPEIDIRGGELSPLIINAFSPLYLPRGEDLPPLLRSPINIA